MDRLTTYRLAICGVAAASESSVEASTIHDLNSRLLPSWRAPTS